MSVRRRSSASQPPNGEGGVEAADERLLDEAVALFDTEDAQNAIESLLAAGRGKASFAGR
jgi:hypothetical protein